MKRESVLVLGTLAVVLLAGALIGRHQTHDDRHDKRVRTGYAAHPPKHSIVDESAARRVRTHLRGLRGVTAAHVAFGEGDELTSAVRYDVDLGELAKDADVLRVVEAAYRAFRDDFAATSASLEITRKNDHVTVETRRPSTTVAEVVRIARYAFRESAHDDLVVTDIQAREDLPHGLLGDVRVNLRGGRSRTPADVLARLDAIDPTRIPPDTGVGVTDDAGDGLVGGVGLPTARARALWARMNDQPFPTRVGFTLSEDGGNGREQGWFVNATIERPAPGMTDLSNLVAPLARTLDLLGQDGATFRFAGMTTPTVEYTLWFDSTTCEAAVPPSLNDLKQEFLDGCE